MYDSDGNEVGKYDSFILCSRAHPDLKLCPSMIGHVARGKYKQYKGYTFKFQDESDLSIHRLKIPVVMYDLNMNELGRYKDAAECSRVNGFTSTSKVHEVCRGDRKIFSGLIFRYAEEVKD